MPESSNDDGLATVEREVRAALRSHPGTAWLADSRLQAVQGGLSNFSWQARASTGEDFFVRLARGHGDLLGADHENERRVLALTSSAGLSPEVVRCDPAARLLVTRWIDAPTVGRALRGATQLRAVARALAALHALRTPPDLRIVDFEAQARELAMSSADGRDDAALRASGAAVFVAMREQSVSLALCHNDLNPLNLLLDARSRLWLVDWEYAGLGDPALDLASFACQHGLQAAQRKMLIGTYAAAGGLIDAPRLERAAWAFDFVQWLWYRAALAHPEAGVDAQVAVDRATRLAASLRRRASRVLRCNNAAFAE